MFRRRPAAGNTALSNNPPPGRGDAIESNSLIGRHERGLAEGGNRPRGRGIAVLCRAVLRVLVAEGFRRGAHPDAQKLDGQAGCWHAAK